MLLTHRLIVHGRVQGVWYRGWAVDEARALGLSGWVRNRRDGSVEMLLEGGEEAVAAMIERCHVGPPAARVDRIEVADSDENVPPGFESRPTL
jgi:acylphosphatase